MFVRIRWFFLGVLGTVGVGAWLMARVRKLRASFTRTNVKRAGTEGVAALLDSAARRIDPQQR